MTREEVVLVADDGTAIGTAEKATVHHAETPLHLAFSCYVLDGDRLLLTRRAASKTTWPATWTNTACGHPAPGERVVDAAVRRCRDELGLGVRDVRLVLPRFRYRAVMPDGTVEHELCPVLVARPDGDPDPDPAEVDDWRWETWPDVVEAARSGAWGLSPWSVLQVEDLVALGPEPGSWPTAAHADLPEAARPA